MKLYFFVFILFLTISNVSSYDIEFFQICGGTDEFIFLCNVGDNEFNNPFSTFLISNNGGGLNNNYNKTNITIMDIKGEESKFKLTFLGFLTFLKNFKDYPKWMWLIYLIIFLIILTIYCYYSFKQ